MHDPASELPRITLLRTRENSGGGAAWIKTVRDGEGKSFPICDPCYLAYRGELVTVPGPFVVWARCDLCQRFVNPREIVPDTLGPAAWKEAYGETCRMCAV